MACDQEILILISAFADGETTPEESTQAKSHLDTCPDCRRMVKDWQEERQLLEWAYTLELPQEITIPTEGRGMGVETPRQRRGFTFNWRWNWGAVGALAVVLLLSILGINYYKHRPYVLGNSLTTGDKKQIAQVAEGIQIEVGQGSKVTRIDEKTIRLDAGWLRAVVKHGNGFQILTKRLKIMDIGTKFQVSTGPKVDVVSVEEGEVDVRGRAKSQRVNEGQCLVVKDAEISTYTLPLEDEGDASTTLADEVKKITPKGFTPQDGNALDWIAGLKSLQSRFPDIRLKMGLLGLGNVTFTQAVGAVPGIRDHCSEIAQYLNGGQTNNDWEVPVGVVQVAKVVKPVILPADTYYLQLSSHSGRLMWRLEGAKGSDADIPVVAKIKGPYTRNGSYVFVSFGENQNMLVMAGWPIGPQPQLTLTFQPETASKNEQDKARVRTEVMQRVAGVKGLELRDYGGRLVYLDLARRHWVFVSENWAGVDQFKSMGTKPGSALVAVVASDVRWIEPSRPAGVYLIWWTRLPEDKQPHWEVSDLNGANRSNLVAMPSSAMDNSHGYRMGGADGFAFNSGSQIKSSFPFSFSAILGHSRYPMGNDGYFRVTKP